MTDKVLATLSMAALILFMTGVLAMGATHTIKRGDTLYSLAKRFPDQATRDRLAAAVGTIPSGRDFPAFQAANDFLSQPL